MNHSTNLGDIGSIKIAMKRRFWRMSKEFKDLPVKLDNAFWELLDILVTRGVLNPKDRKDIEGAYEE